MAFTWWPVHAAPGRVPPAPLDEVVGSDPVEEGFDIEEVQRVADMESVEAATEEETVDPGMHAAEVLADIALAGAALGIGSVELVPDMGPAAEEVLDIGSAEVAGIQFVAVAGTVAVAAPLGSGLGLSLEKHRWGWR